MLLNNELSLPYLKSVDCFVNKKFIYQLNNYVAYNNSAVDCSNKNCDRYSNKFNCELILRCCLFSIGLMLYWWILLKLITYVKNNKIKYRLNVKFF